MRLRVVRNRPPGRDELRKIIDLLVADAVPLKERGNGLDRYVLFGEVPGGRWEDAVKSGFVFAGGDEWCPLLESVVTQLATHRQLTGHIQLTDMACELVGVAVCQPASPPPGW